MNLGLESKLETIRKIKPHEETPNEFTNSIGMKFIKIPKGKFYMGVSEKEKEALPSEKPLHEINLTRDFAISETTVTLMHFYRLFQFPMIDISKNENLPLTNISWLDIEIFTNELNRQEKLCSETAYRLPTEAEWEYSSICSSYNPHYRKKDESITVYSSQNTKSLRFATDLETNSFGLKGMLGNIWEFCSDWYEEKYYSRSPLENPIGPENGVFKVARGGSYLNTEIECRGTLRNHYKPNSKLPNLGFRLIKMIKEPKYN
jgi:formylglycine-generating enzyme required for sulfatase activity